MLRLLNPQGHPREPFVYVAEGGARFENRDLRVLEQKVRDYFRGNDRPIPANLAQAIIEAQCAKFPHLCFDDAAGAPSDQEPSIGIEQARRFLATVARSVASAWRGKAVLVEPAEAERRAAICAGCRLNVRVRGCVSCDIGREAVARLRFLAGRTTTQDAALRGCAACGCSLRAKVHLRREVMARTAPYERNCWMREEPAP